MPKNKTGGNKFKKQKKIKRDNTLVLKTPDTIYCVIKSILGNGRCALEILDKTGIVGTITGFIRGSVRKIRFAKGDYVLCGLRDFGPKDEVDIIKRYGLDHVQQLIYLNEIKRPDNFTDDVIFENDDIMFEQNDENDNNIDIEATYNHISVEDNNINIDNTIYVDEDIYDDDNEFIDQPMIENELVSQEDITNDISEMLNLIDIKPKEIELKKSIQKKLDGISSNGKKNKAVIAAKRDGKKNQQTYNIDDI
jgi:initiation factor 1A